MTKDLILTSSEPLHGEYEFDDNSPVYGDYLYVAKMADNEFKVVRSDWHGVPAGRLKHELGALALYRCNLKARGFFK